MKIKTKFFKENARTPIKKHDGDFCYDLYATDCQWISKDIVAYKLGLGFEPVRPWWMKILKNLRISIDGRCRSGVWKSGLILSNCIATIDEIFRGECSAIFYRILDEGTPWEYEGEKGVIEHYKVGDRVLQMHVSITGKITFITADQLGETDRGEGKYGSTGR